MNANNLQELYFSMVNPPRADYEDVYHIEVLIFNSGRSKIWPVGKTEVLPFKQEINFKTPIKIGYDFCSVDDVKVELYISKSGKTEKFSEVRLGMNDILCNSLEVNLLDENGKLLGNERDKSKLLLRTKNAVSDTLSIYFGFKITGVEKAHYLHNNHFKLYKLKGLNPTRWKPVCKSPTSYKGSLTWSKVVVKMKDLCMNDLDVLMNFSLFSSNKIIADCHFKVLDRKELLERGCVLRRAEKVGLIKNRASRSRYGQLNFTEFKVREKFNFVSYLKGKQKFTPIYAIDFTESNLVDTDTKCLHSMDTDNPYMNAIKVLHEKFEKFNQDVDSLLWGFGARIGNQQSDCFCLTFDENKLTCKTFEEMKNYYFDCLKRIEFGKKKRILELIKIASIYAQNNKDNQNYFVVFILTTSQNVDNSDILTAIRKTSIYPISFVFVGIGSGEFKFFNNLQSLKKNEGKEVRKNITTAKYEKIKRSCPESDFSRYFLDQSLSKIPSQFLQYCKEASLIPKCEERKINRIQKEAPKTALFTEPLIKPKKVNRNIAQKVKAEECIGTPEFEKMNKDEQMKFILKRWTTIAAETFKNEKFDFYPAEMTVKVPEYLKKYLSDNAPNEVNHKNENTFSTEKNEESSLNEPEFEKEANRNEENSFEKEASEEPKDNITEENVPVKERVGGEEVREELPAKESAENLKVEDITEEKIDIKELEEQLEDKLEDERQHDEQDRTNIPSSKEDIHLKEVETERGVNESVENSGMGVKQSEDETKSEIIDSLVSEGDNEQSIDQLFEDLNKMKKKDKKVIVDAA